MASSVVLCRIVAGAADAPKPAPDGVISATAITPDPKPAADPFEAARFTLELKGVPLGHMLRLLETTTGLQFHYGAPPDGVVYNSYHNAPLLPTLQEILVGNGLWMQRRGSEAYLLPLGPAGVESSATSSPAAKANRGAATKPTVASTVLAWRYLAGVKPPPAQWMFGSSGIASGDDKTAWVAATVNIETARRPAFSLDVPQAAAPSAIAKPVWLRWPLTLRHRPEHMQLLLETPATATLYVNGAPLLRRWQGSRFIDLGQALQQGENNLALFWPAAPTAGAPLLRYEWFIAGAPQGTGAGLDGNAVIAGGSPTSASPRPLPPRASRPAGPGG